MSSPPNTGRPAYLDPSPLGTKEYWDNIYASDQRLHSELPEHTGQTWFDDNDAEQKTLDFLRDEGPLHGLPVEDASVLDLGTGNAGMLLELRKEGFNGPMYGVDYSEESVRFARALVKEWEESDEADQVEGVQLPSIEILQHDILSTSVPEGFPSGGFDLVLDKGTFDAISLSETPLPDGRRACDIYRERVEPLVRLGGLMLITSCNWTEAELEHWMGGGNLKVVGRLSYGKFKFGGKEGGVLCGLCWRRAR